MISTSCRPLFDVENRVVLAIVPAAAEQAEVGLPPLHHSHQAIHINRLRRPHSSRLLRLSHSPVHADVPEIKPAPADNHKIRRMFRHKATRFGPLHP